MPLICRIELNKNTGITVKVENKDGQITNTAEFKADQIVLTSKGPTDTSTITQTPDSITIKCKTFTLETETTTCKSTRDTQITALNITETANVNAQITAKNNAVMEGTAKAEVKGAQLALQGMVKADMKAPLISIKADGMLTAEGLLTSVKGQITNVQGTLVKVG